MDVTVEQTAAFALWLKAAKDMKAKIAIYRRIERARLGNLGDCRAVGDGVKEMRIDVGPGYRLYFIVDGRELVVLLCGGDKGSQSGDIKRAQLLARECRSRLSVLGESHEQQQSDSVRHVGHPGQR